MRADSGYYTGAVVAACHRAGARLSITTRMDAKVRRAIADIGDDAWMPIKYPKAVWDDELNCWSPMPRSPKPPTPRSRPNGNAAPPPG